MSDEHQDREEVQRKSLLTDEILRACEDRIPDEEGDGGAASLETVAEPHYHGNSEEAMKKRFIQLGVSEPKAEKLAGSMLDKGGAVATIETAAAASELIAAGVPEDSLIGFERILGTNEMMDVRFLQVGASRARSVARVVVRKGGKTLGHGTGFMISPRLFLTNNHVLKNSEIAASSFIEFNFEIGPDGSFVDAVAFQLSPDEFFATNSKLDFTLVAVKTIGAGGAEISDFGFIDIPNSEDTILVKETVNIIQHPGGERKQVALRENKVSGIQDAFLHYQTDTARGSSGSCVLNDQWELVALHHAGKPRRDENGNVLTTDDQIWDPDTMSDRDIDWIANEGVRIPAIIRHLRSLNFPQAPAALLKKAIGESDGSDESSDQPPPAPAPPSKDAAVVKQISQAQKGEAAADSPPDNAVATSTANSIAVSAVAGASTVTVPLEITIRVLPPEGDQDEAV